MTDGCCYRFVHTQNTIIPNYLPSIPLSAPTPSSLPSPIIISNQLSLIDDMVFFWYQAHNIYAPSQKETSPFPIHSIQRKKKRKKKKIRVNR